MPAALSARRQGKELKIVETLHSEPVLISPDSLMPDAATANFYRRFFYGGQEPLTFVKYQSLNYSKPEFMSRDFSPVIPDSAKFEPDPLPDWLKVGKRANEQMRDLRYSYMIDHPFKIRYAYWKLDKRRKIKEADQSYSAFLRSMRLPGVDTSKAVIAEVGSNRRYWLHFFNTGLQFSQAYISSNWYQGGNNYLSLLFNFDWNVELNTVYNPKLLFQSALSYKLAINSNPKESLHSYSITQDNFQYNLKAGFKAFNHWFYSLTMQVKTPFFKSYPADSESMSAAFLSPGTFNFGLGMSYTLVNKKKTFNFGLSIAPLSYNLKTCVNSALDPTLFGIKKGSTSLSEIGSNAEANIRWNIASNILLTSRIFLFTDYKYFQADWEATIQFNINRFLSTQIYLHPRYDSSTNFNSSRWHYWMLKEILSFGLSYTFSTKG